MALTLGGRHRRGRAGVRLAGRHVSGPTARGTSTTWPTASSRTSSTPTCAPTSPRACGIGGSCTQRPRVRREPVASGRARHRLRARAADTAWRDPVGPPRRRHPVVVRAARRARRRSATPALRHRASRSCSGTSAPTGSSRPRSWRTSSSTRARCVRAQAPLGDGLVLPRAHRCRGRRGGAGRLDERHDAFVMDGRGVRCVGDRPWVTVAETCECALARCRSVTARWPASCSAGRSSSASRTLATGPGPSTPT